MDIVNQRELQSNLLDTVARAALGRSTCGVSVGGGMSRIHLMNDSPAEQQRAIDLLNNFDTLLAGADKASAQVGEAAPVITCSDDIIAVDSHLGYLILLDDEAVTAGRVDVIEGVSTLLMRDLVAGVYTVFIYRLRENFASATLRIRVDEAQAQ